MSSTPSDPDGDNNPMKIPVSPARAHTLAQNIAQVQSRITAALASSSNSSSHHPQNNPPTTKQVRLVAVSKLKPASDVLALHAPPTSHLHFGENYVQELLEKSRLLPSSVRWHFIGGLQSNKCVQLAREVRGLWAVESVDSVKKARLLDKGRGEGDGEDDKEQGRREPLRVFVQVNTSGEESKSGVRPKSDELLELCGLVRGEECGNLRLQGLMTIGAIARSQATTTETENEDFVCLRENRDWIAEKLGMGEGELELSMGMSEDFEGAIAMGSDEVRVGSTIFGERPPKKDARVIEDVEGKK